MSVTSSQTLTKTNFASLLQVARQAISDYLADGIAKPPSLNNYPAPLREFGACFVTLTVAGELQGCLGTLEARTPLVLEVYNKAFASSHQDHRFTPLIAEQLGQLCIEISVLTKPVPLTLGAETDLYHYLSQHKCGVILSDAGRRAVFLPQVWQQLPTPEQFIAHLKQKAGWHTEYWSDTMQVSTFEVESEEAHY